MNNEIPNTLSTSELRQYFTYLLDNSFAALRFLPKPNAPGAADNA